MNVHKFTDLAFLFSHWMPDNIRSPHKQESIAFILRDWIFNDHVAVLLSVAKALIAAGHDIKFFAFDEDSDAKFIHSAASLGPVYCWKPTEMTIEKYLFELAKCKLVISSRAHGAIVSACLGIPVCCVCIEPKLQQVAMMLVNSARIIKEPFKLEEILRQIENTFERTSGA